MGNKEIRESKSIRTGKGKIYSICVINNNRLACCFSDNTIKIFNLITNQCELILIGHTDQVTYISCLKENSLISSSLDNTIKIWSIYNNNYNCDFTLQAHNDVIYQVIPLSNDRFASCSYDKTIKIWSSIYPYSFINYLEKNDKLVNSIYQIKNKELLVSCSMEGTKFWSLTTYQVQCIFSNIYSFNSNIIQINENTIILCYQDKIISINIETYQIELMIIDKVIKSFDCLVYLKEDLLISGNDNGNIYMININEKKINLIYEKAHSLMITDLVSLSDDKIISVSSDGFIKEWIFTFENKNK